MGRTNIMTNSILPELRYRTNAIPIKIHMLYFTGLEKKRRIHMEPQKTKATLRSKNAIGTITIPGLNYT